VDIRRIGVFHNTAQVGCAWCCSEGLVTTLASMNYEVLNLGHPQTTSVPIETLRRMDLIILGAPEWFDTILFARYGQAWLDMEVTKVCWYAESAHRDDRNFDFRRCRVMGDLHYFPALQDAEEFGGRWMPFAADTLLFHPADTERRFETAFLGTMYPKRAEYIQQIGFPLSLMPPVHDPNPVKSFLLLADAYRSTNIFVNLPAYSRLLVTKVTEILACRTMLVTPAVDHPSGVGNMRQFENGKHLVYYDQNKPGELYSILKHYTEDRGGREAIACAGWEEISRAHTMQHRVEQMLSDARALLRQRPQRVAAHL
jgi:hypothetical protein